MKTILLRAESLELLGRPVVGRGGFQSLMRRLQAGLRGRVLTLSTKDLDALIRHCSGRTLGGFQLRARALIVDYVLNDLFAPKAFKLEAIRATQGSGRRVRGAR